MALASLPAGIAWVESFRNIITREHILKFISLVEVDKDALRAKV